MRARGSDLSIRVADTPISGWTVAACVLAICFLGGLSLAWIPPEIVLGLTVLGVLAVIGIRWPYVGLIVYLCMEFLRPAERLPVLAPLHLTRVIAVFVMIGWLFRRRRDGFDLWVRSPENTAVLGLLCAAAISVPTAYWKLVAFDAVLDVLRTAMVFILIANIINTPKRLMGFITTYILLNVFASGEQLIRYATTSAPAAGGLLRVAGAGSFLGEDGDFALAMGVALPFVYYTAWSHVKPVWRVLSGVACLMFLASIVCTGSRGGVVGLVAVVLVLVARSRRRLVAAMVVMGVVLVAWTLAPSAYRQRIATIAAPHERDLTAQTRMVSWKAARRMFMDHPVTGVGAGNFMPAFVGAYGGGYGWSTTAHNVFYQTIAELGICGILPFTVLLLCTFSRSLLLNAELVRAGFGTTPVAAYAAALFPSALGFIVAGSFQTPLYYPHIYLIAALGVALNNIAKPLVAQPEEKEVHGKWSPERMCSMRAWR